MISKQIYGCLYTDCKNTFDCVMAEAVFDANCNNQVLRVLKYLTCLHELYVSAPAALHAPRFENSRYNM